MNTRAFCLMAGICFSLGLARVGFAGWILNGGAVCVNSTRDAQQPSLGMFNGAPLVAWVENDGLLNRVHAASLAGAGWSPLGSVLTGASDNASLPSLGCSGLQPWAAWSDSSGSPNQIMVKRFTGADWEAAGGSLNADPAHFAYAPSVECSSATPYVAWEEADAGGIYQIYVKHWDGAWQADGAGSLNVNSAQQAHGVSLARCAGILYAAWSESDGIHNQIYVKRLNGGAWEQAGGSLNMNTQQNAGSPCLAALGPVPYAVWVENSGVNSQLWAKRFNGAAWEIAGGNLNRDPAQPVWEPDLAAGSGTLHAAWVEGSGVPQAHVSFYNGSSWQALGGGLNVNPARNAHLPSLAFSGATPYVAWQEGDEPGIKVFVARFTAAVPAIPSVSPSPSPTEAAAPPAVVFSAFPNPARRHIRFAWSQAGLENPRIEVYNPAGERIALLTPDVAGTEISWDIPEIASGIYFYRAAWVQNGSKQQSAWRKFSIQR